MSLSQPVLSSGAFRREVLRDTSEPMRLTDTRIDGDVDLRWSSVRRPVLVEGCRFTGRLDCRNAAFAATLSLRGCEFHATVSLGDREFSHTSIASDLVFTDSEFAAPVHMLGLHCDGSGHFERCEFGSTASGPETPGFPPLHPNDFSAARFGASLLFNGSTFAGGASFNGVHVEHMTSFAETSFNTEEHSTTVDLVAAQFGIAAEFADTAFSGPVDMSGSRSSLLMLFERAYFAEGAPADLSSVATEHLFLNGCHFGAGLTAVGIRIGRDLTVGPSLLARDLPVPEFADDGALTNETLAGVEAAGPQVDLTDLRFTRRGKENDTHSWVADAPHGRAVALHRERTGDGALADSVSALVATTADAEVSMFSAVVGWNLLWTIVDFRGGVDANGLHVGGGLFITHSLLRSSVDLRFSTIEKNLQIAGSVVPAFLDTESVRIADTLALTANTEVTGTWDLTDAVVHRLTIDEGVTLRGCLAHGLRFDHVKGTHLQEHGATELSSILPPKQFSIDPYLSMERHYRAAADAKNADTVYVQGRLAQRRAAGTPDVRWTRLDWIKDTFALYGSRYGTSLARPVALAAGCILFGILVFLQGAALSFDTGHPRSGTTPGLVDRVGYAVDQFVPVADLGFTDDMVVPTAWLQWVGAFLTVSGFVLVPLIIASVSGLLKRRA